MKLFKVILDAGTLEITEFYEFDSNQIDGQFSLSNILTHGFDMHPEKAVRLSESDDYSKHIALVDVEFTGEQIAAYSNARKLVLNKLLIKLREANLDKLL